MRHARPIVCPAILSESSEEFTRQMCSVADFALRVHIDLADGDFAPVKTVAISDIWWPANVRADLHIMYRHPTDHLETYLALQPQMVIVHAEAQGQFKPLADALHEHDIEVGVALLASTGAQIIEKTIDDIDYVLVFSGDLGHFGGKADLELLKKVTELREMKPTLEIGWDGGVNDQNAWEIVKAGVDVLNAGGFIQKAKSPEEAYDQLTTLVQT